MEVVRPLFTVVHVDPDLTVELRPFLCRPLETGQPPVGRGVEELRWVRIGELGRYRFPAANAPLLDELARLPP